MNAHVITLFPRKQTAPTLTPLDGDHLRRLNTVSRAIRRLRAMGIGVSNVLPGDDRSLPTLLLRVSPHCRIAPLLEATAGRRRYLPAGAGMPDRMSAEMDGCLLVWVMNERRGRARPEMPSWLKKLPEARHA
jgi:hypothetical protein